MIDGMGLFLLVVVVILVAILEIYVVITLRKCDQLLKEYQRQLHQLQFEQRVTKDKPPT